MSAAEILEVAVRAARAGGEVLLDGLAGELEIEHKDGHVDLVTSADRRSQDAVFAVIRDAFPGHALLGEEGTAGDPEADGLWIVDPLDGTTNYVHGWPLFSVSIAHRAGGRLVCGVVLDPWRDELYTATAGGGATCNGVPLRVSDVDTLSRALLVTQVQSSDAAVIREYVERLERLIHLAGGVRNPGSPALVLCAVAAGRLEGFCERRIKPWDVAAGSLIVAEAGGRVSDFDGDPAESLEPVDLVATNGRIHAELIEALRAPDEEAVR